MLLYDRYQLLAWTGLVALVGFGYLACSNRPQADMIIPTSATPQGIDAPTETGQALPIPTDIWTAFWGNRPHAYTTPLPPRIPSVLDGFYVKSEPLAGKPVPCRRCPDYLPAGGLWRLNLDQGVFRILHSETGWRSLGSFTVTQDRILLFNDPTCFETVGTYRWRMEAGALSFQVVEDTCQVDRRARSFSITPWSACQPAPVGAGADVDWMMPATCD